MGKRSEFERNPRDFYPTPYDAVLPLFGHLKSKITFIEPCAGDGRLIRHLEKHNHKCLYACDIEPINDENSNIIIDKQDSLFFGYQLPKADFIITNPPWKRDVLHEMIEHYKAQMPTWLLFDSDWMFTGQAKPYLKYCDKIVSVGRVSWMENGTSGMDNCAWYLFINNECQTKFYNL